MLYSFLLNYFFERVFKMQQLNQCLICGKWFAQWIIKIYSDETVEKFCSFCNAPQQIKEVQI